MATTVDFMADGCKWNADSSGCYLCIPVKTSRHAVSILEKLEPGKQYTAQIRQKRKHRSLDANAYYRKLCSLMADKLNISTNRTHNLMMRRYGAPSIIDGSLLYTFLPDTEEAEETAWELETLHLKPTTSVKDGNDGERYRAYYVIKGSHEYNTKEMSVLINGIVSECREMGIETRPPEEVESLLAEYAKTYQGASNH